MAYKIDTDKAMQAVLYIIERFGRIDFHKLFKILYFADQKHLLHYGRPIIGDEYIAMANGPVPSRIYDIVKIIRDLPNGNQDVNSYYQSLAVEDHYFVVAKIVANTDYLSETDIECLNESMTENGNLGYSALRDKSHDFAWVEANNNGMNSMKFIDIAKAAGASDSMIEYINTLQSNDMMNDFSNSFKF